MQILDIEPNTSEHFDIRKKHFCASEASAVMNQGKFDPKNQLDLAAVKKGIKKVNVYQPAVQHGNDNEPFVRERVNEMLSDLFQPKICVEGKYLASPDGLNFSGSTYLEIKCPFSPNSETIKSAKNNEIVNHYKWQLDHGLYVTGADKAVFAVLHPETKDITLIDYFPDEERQAQLIDAWADFEKIMKRPSDEIADLTSTTPSPRFNNMVDGLIDLYNQRDSLSDDIKILEQQLLKEHQGTSWKSDKISIVRKKATSGNLKYKDIYEHVKDQISINLEDFRSKPTKESFYIKRR